MKKLLLASACLLIFSISILLFQASCHKDANAKTTNTTNTNGGITQAGKIVYLKITAKASPPYEIWTANYDGSNQQMLPVQFPSNMDDITSISMSPDGSKIFFVMFSSSTTGTPGNIYSCNSDGSNVTQIIGNSTPGTYYTGVYPY